MVTGFLQIFTLAVALEMIFWSRLYFVQIKQFWILYNPEMHANETE
jgi:hypothetical protein